MSVFFSPIHFKKIRIVTIKYTPVLGYGQITGRLISRFNKAEYLSAGEKK